MRPVLNSVLAFLLCASGAAAEERAQMDTDWLRTISDTCTAMTLMEFDTPQPDLTGLGFQQSDQTYDIVAGIAADIMRFRIARQGEQSGLKSPGEYGADVVSSMVEAENPDPVSPLRTWSYSADGIGLSHVIYKRETSSVFRNYQRGFCRVYAKGALSRRAAEDLARAVVGETDRCRNHATGAAAIVHCERRRGRLDVFFEVQIFDEITGPDGTRIPPTVHMTLNQQLERRS